MSVGQRMLSSVIANGNVAEFLKMGLKPELFKPAERPAYLFIADHVKKYNVIPEKDTFLEGCDYPLVDVGKESPKYFVDELRKRYLSDELVSLMIKSKALIKDDLNPEAALETMLDQLVALKFVGAGTHLVDFREIKGMVIDTYKAKLESENGGGILTGWTSFDEMSQGMMGGDLVSVVGRPAAGKTFLGLWLAHHAWWIQQQPVLFVSMEMMVPVVANRLTAMHSKLNLTHLNKATLSSKSFNKMRDDLVEIQDHKSALYLMDGNLTATVEDIWSTASQLKPSLIVVDGGYLLGHPNNRLDRFNRVAENTRLLKNQVATDLNTPVVCSWQFSRQAVKKKVEDTGLEDIGFSDEIGQLSSIVLGLFEQESVETLHRRRVDIMKGRGGEKGHFDIYWDFYRCYFGEFFMPTDQELSFL